MFKILFAIGICLLASMSHADTTRDIAIKFDQIKPGSSVTYLTETGEQRTHHFEGPTEDGYAISYWNGPAKATSDTLHGTGYFNKTGQMMRFQRADGQVTTFHPHNCFRVIGACSYTARWGKDRSSRYETVITPTEIGFKFEQHRFKDEEKTLWTKGAVSLDEMGMMDVLMISKSRSQNMVSQKQETADYR